MKPDLRSNRRSNERDARPFEPTLTATDDGDMLRTRAPDGAVPDELPTVDPAAYAMIGEEGRGGLGRVLAAEDLRLGRVVAVKELIHESAESARRFLREVRMTARLQHPAIVPVYEAGRWPQGKMFYAMKLVRGRSLKELIHHKATLAERLALLPNLITVAEAIGYAHSRNIIHRDLKPANVMVGEFGETVVIDWGLAKDLDEETLSCGLEDGPFRSVAELHTIAGTVVGTPSYMPPEQAAAGAVDERADVYALGAMLYHVLAGVAPYRSSSTAETLAAILRGPPPRVESREPGVPGDLATIVAKAMARNPEDRYRSAKSMAEDLLRFQTGQLVGAHRYSRATLLLRWARRNRAALLVATALLFTLGASLTVSVRRIVRERDRAEHERSLATQRAHALTLTQARTSLAVDPTTAVAWIKSYPTDAIDQQSAKAIVSDAVARGVAGFVAHASSVVRTVAISPDGGRIAVGGQGLAVEEWTRPHDRARVLPFRTTTIQIVYSADGRVLAAAGEYGRVAVASAGGPMRELIGHHAMVLELAFSPDARSLVTADAAGTVWVWDVASGRGRALPFPGAASTRVTFDAQGRALAVVAIGRELAVWDVEKRARLSRIAVTSNIDELELAAGACVVAARSGDGLSVWAPTSRKHIADVPARSGLAGFMLSDDGTRLAYWYDDRTVELRNLDDGTTQRLDYPQRVFVARFAPDHDVIALGGVGGMVALWDLAADSVQTLAGHAGIISHLAFSADGSSLVSCAAEDRDVRVWPVRRLVRRVLRELPGIVIGGSFSSDGTLFATGSSGGTARIWDVTTGKTRLVLRHGDLVQDVAFSRDDGLLAFASWDESARWIDLRTGASGTLRHGARVQRVQWLGDRRELATASMDGTISIWTIADGKRVILGKHEGPVSRLQLSADGQTLLTAGDDHTIRLWSVASRSGRIVGRHDDEVNRATFLPDGRGVVAISIDGAVKLWDVASGRARTLRESGSRLNALAVSADGALIAAGGVDGTILVWSRASAPLRVLRGHDAAVRSVAFSPDGRLLASASSDRTARLWDMRNGGMAVLRGHESYVNGLAFLRDGALLATMSGDATTRLWPVRSIERMPSEDLQFRSYLAKATNVVVVDREQ